MTAIFSLIFTFVLIAVTCYLKAKIEKELRILGDDDNGIGF